MTCDVHAFRAHLLKEQYTYWCIHIIYTYSFWWKVFFSASFFFINAISIYEIWVVYRILYRETRGASEILAWKILLCVCVNYCFDRTVGANRSISLKVRLTLNLLYSYVRLYNMRIKWKKFRWVLLSLNTVITSSYIVDCIIRLKIITYNAYTYYTYHWNKTDFKADQ